MYDTFYKFSGKPFQLSPDPRFFFKSHGHKRALAYLLYGVKQGEGFIVVTGDVGTGKTTLVQTLFRVLEKANVVAAQLVSTQIEEDDLLRMVSAAFGLPYEGVTKAGLLRGLEVFFRACHQEGKRVLLVVDEAQNLPPRAVEELRMLSNFQINGRMLLQSFLLGQKEFRVTMRSEGFEQLRQRVIAAYHLRPLDLAETRGYVEHRLRLVGWQNDPSFEDAVFDRIHEFTGGIPRRVNTLCDRLLLHAGLEQAHHITVQTIAEVTDDISEEHGMPATSAGAGGGWNLGATVRPLNTGYPRPVQAAPLSGEADQRIQSVEHSVEALAGAFREELALLRQAILANAKTGTERDDGKR